VIKDTEQMNSMCCNKDEDKTTEVQRSESSRSNRLFQKIQTFAKTVRCGGQWSLHVCTEQSTNV